MTLFVDQRWNGPHGIGRYATEVNQRLEVPHSPYGIAGRPMSVSSQLKALNPLHFIGMSNTFYSPGFYVPLVTTGTVVPTIHDLIHLNFPEERSTTKTAYYKLLRLKLLDQPLIFTVSKFSRDEIGNWLGDKFQGNIVVTGNGLSDTFKQNRRTSNPYQDDVIKVYIPGSEKPHKNVLTQLKACATVNTQQQLRVYLTGNYSTKFRNEASKLGIEIQYKGFLTETELCLLYANVDLVLFCSKYEGYGLPIIEAYSQGTPVITSDITSMPEVSENPEMLASPNSIEEISSRIEQVTSKSIIPIKANKSCDWDNVANIVSANLSKLTS